jgi:UPF0755 protein
MPETGPGYEGQGPPSDAPTHGPDPSGFHGEVTYGSGGREASQGGGDASQEKGRRGSGGSGLGSAIRRHPLTTALCALAVVALGLLGWVVAWYEGSVGGSPGGARTVVEVSQGSSVSAITDRLASRGVLDSSLAFRIYLTLHGTPVIQPGGYFFRLHQDFASVRSTLSAGPDVFDLDIPPGFTVWETAERVGGLRGHSDSSFLALATSGTVHSPYQPAGSTNLDGLLGTGTYVVVPGESDRTLLEQMVQRFDKEAQQVGLAAGAQALGMTPYQVVTVASIVEKEGVYSENLGPVARVIYNRLAIGMKLQMDSTVLYAEHRDGGTVRSSDLNLNTPYNTYLYPGLTPTPICFPSIPSLRAALQPPPGKWLYFVLVSANGREAFSDTLAEQQQNEALAASRGLP